MALGEITGATVAGITGLRSDFLKTPLSRQLSFEEAYCLTRIGKQPEEYDGPTRYCQNRAATQDDGTKAVSCRFHGGAGSGSIDPLANMSHGFFVNSANLEDTLEDFELEFYEEVMYEWPDKYGIDFEADPSAAEDLHALAQAIIRDERANAELNRNRDLTVHRSQYDAQGIEVGTEPDAHYLIDKEQSQRRLVMKMKDELGISRKHRDVMDSTEDATDAVSGLVEGMRSALDKEEHDYDPDDFED